MMRNFIDNLRLSVVDDSDVKRSVNAFFLVNRLQVLLSDESKAKVNHIDI